MIKTVKVIRIEWNPDRLYPNGAHMCDVTARDERGQITTKSTRAHRTPQGAWDEAQELIAKIKYGNGGKA